MSIYQTIVTRRTTHQFSPDQELPPHVLDEALSAAHHAPCHKHTWPWRFRILGPQTRAALVEIGVQMQRQRGASEQTCRPILVKKLMSPSAVVVVTQQLCGEAFREQEDYAACACAVQNMLLSLHDQGWASKWGTGALTRWPEALQALGIQPDQERSVGWIYIGRPAAEPSAPPRPDPAEVIQRLP